MGSLPIVQKCMPSTPRVYLCKSVTQCEFIPKNLEDELIKQHITSVKPALYFIEDTMARLNGDSVAGFEERKIQFSTNIKPAQPFFTLVLSLRSSGLEPNMAQDTPSAPRARRLLTECQPTAKGVCTPPRPRAAPAGSPRRRAYYVRLIQTTRI